MYSVKLKKNKFGHGKGYFVQRDYCQGMWGGVQLYRHVEKRTITKGRLLQ
jgi:hypothetical protein